MATELAKAYVQIIPSAEGIGGKLNGLLGGEAAAAGDYAGKSLGKTLVGTLTKVLAAAGIGKALQSAFASGSQFETAVAKVATIADTGSVSIETLRGQITAMSGETGVAAGDIAEAAYQAISAGQKTENAVAFAGQATKLAAAGFTSSASAVDILTTALNAYGMSADAASHVSDVLLTTQNLGKTSVDELASSMGRVIPLASAYGVSIENLSSVLAVLTANGIATAEASTYAKSMLNELGSTGSNVAKVLKEQTGQSFADLMASGKSLGDVLQVLYDSVDGDSTRFNGLWSSVEAGTAALSLASSGAGRFNEVLGQMQADSKLTESAYETMTDTMAHKMDALKTNAQNLGIALFDAVGGKLGEGVSLASGYLQALTQGFQSGGLAGLADSLGGIFTDLFMNVLPAVTQSGTELLNGLAAGMAQGVPALLAQALPMLETFSGSLRENAGKLVDAGLHLLVQLVQGLVNGLPTLIAYVPTIITNIAGIINDNMPKILLTGIQILLMLIQGIVQSIPALIENAGQIVQAIFSVIMAFNWISLGGKIVTLLKNGISSLASLPGKVMRNIARSVYNTFKNGFSWHALGQNIIQGLINGVGSMKNLLIEAAKNIAKTFLDSIKKKFGIASPSKVMRDQVGRWIPLGMAEGIRRTAGSVAAAMANLTDVNEYSIGNSKALLADEWGTRPRRVVRLLTQSETASGPLPGGGSGNTTYLYQTIHTHDSLTPAEMTREAEDFLERSKWQIP